MTSLSSPASIDCPTSTVHLLCIVTHQKGSHLPHVLRLTELARRLLVRHQFLRSLLEVQVVPLCNDIDLLFDERSQDPPRADGIDGDALFGVLKGNGLGEPNNSMFRSHICRFINRSNNAMNRSNVDNPSPSSLLHIGKRIFAEVKCSTQIKRNNSLPFLIREVHALIDVLHSCIVDKHINSAKFTQSLSYNFFAISRFGQISKNIDRLGIRIFGLEFFNCFFDLFIRGKTIEDNVISPSSQ